MSTSSYEMDETDRKLISALRSMIRPSNSDLARAAGLARGTVQARLNRLVETETIQGWGPEVDAAASGFPVTSFTTLSISQGALDVVVDGLRSIPEVVEVHVTTGRGDLLCRILARSNDDLHETIQRIVALKGIARTDSQLVLSAPIERTVADLVADQSTKPK